MSLAGTVEGRVPVPASPASPPATFYTAQGGNDIWWRSEAPAKALVAKLCVIPEAEMEEALLRPNEDTAFPWTLLEDRNDPSYREARYPAHEGPVAVWTRPDPPRAVHAAQMREQGILCVSEVDDNYLSPGHLNIFQRQSGYDKTDQRRHLLAMASCERIVFSTEVLRDIYLLALRRQFPGTQLPELFVCRNNVPYDDWPEVPAYDGPLRVGWMGSPSHIWDVHLAWNAMLHAKKLGCRTVMIGYDPTVPEGQALPEGMRTAESQAKIDAWKRVRFEHIPWIAPSEFHRAALPVDIGLCPLIDNEHTRGKSDCKSLEYGISGAAVIASNTSAYNRTLVHGETALLVNNELEMLQAVDVLAHDESLRMRLVNNLRQYIYEERGGRQLRGEWTAAVSL